MPYNDLPIGDDPPNEVNVIVEIPLRGDPIKYELDKDKGVMLVDRFLNVAMHYPGNYGFIPHTLSDDGDALDVLIVEHTAVMSGAVVPVRPIGVLFMEDESGTDEKIIAVPIDRLNPFYKDIQNYDQLPEGIRKEIEHFFKHYKDLEKGKWSKISGTGDVSVAKRIINESIAREQRHASQKASNSSAPQKPQI